MPEDRLTAQLTPWRVWHRGDARPVLALHCSLAHSGAWSGLVERISGVTVTALDLPGHGKAADWDGREVYHDLATRTAADLAGILGNGGPVDLFGHSYGATVALRIALARPDLVRSLVLVEPVLFAAARLDPGYAAFEVAHRAVAALLAEGRREAAAEMFHAQWGTGKAFHDLPERQRNYVLKRIPLIAAQNPALIDDTAGMLRPGGLEAIRGPVLMVEGSISPPIIAAVQRALCARLPRATRLIVPGAGHMVPVTHPGLVARAVQMHLDAG